MILSWRPFREQNFVGFNIFLLRDYQQPLDALAKKAFESFDESLHLQKSDPDATQIYHGAHPTRASTLQTARARALRSVPERYRPFAELYLVAVEWHTSPPTLHTLIPAWLLLSTETLQGNQYHLSVSAPACEWVEQTLSAEDAFLYLEVFQRRASILSPSPQENQSFRLSTLMEATSQNQSRLPKLCLSLRGET